MMVFFRVYVVLSALLPQDFSLVQGFLPLKGHGSAQKSSTQLQAELSRRDAAFQASALTLGTLLGLPTVSNAVEESGKSIVITGANSGIGFEAVRRLASAAPHKIVLACRSLEKAQTAVDILQKENSCKATLIPAECDLASKENIAAFVKQLPLSAVDTLCLNAGIARNTATTQVARTVDGFERTIGINHFGHFYLQQLLQPNMASTGRIVVTASGVHDPASPGGAQGVPATLGDLEGLGTQGAACEMIDGEEFNADKAYKDSKLCNIFFTRELQRRLSASEKTKDINVVAFNPGLIVSTGLFRDQSEVFTKIFDVATSNIFKVAETPSYGGGCLAYMTTVEEKGAYYSSPPGSVKYGDAAYGKQFTKTQVSAEAQDEAKGKRLWELSEKALGIST